MKAYSFSSILGALAPLNLPAPIVKLGQPANTSTAANNTVSRCEARFGNLPPSSRVGFFISLLPTFLSFPFCWYSFSFLSRDLPLFAPLCSLSVSLSLLPSSLYMPTVWECDWFESCQWIDEWGRIRYEASHAFQNKGAWICAHKPVSTIIACSTDQQSCSSPALLTMSCWEPCDTHTCQPHSGEKRD